MGVGVSGYLQFVAVASETPSLPGLWSAVPEVKDT